MVEKSKIEQKPFLRIIWFNSSDSTCDLNFVIKAYIGIHLGGVATRKMCLLVPSSKLEFIFGNRKSLSSLKLSSFLALQ